jgi:AraC family transcriptional regulator
MSSVSEPVLKNATASDGHSTITVAINSFQPGLTQIPALPYAIVCMHLGPSVEVTCSRGGRLRHGREVAGDLDIIPARTPSAWETKQGGTTLIMRVPDTLLKSVASELEVNPGSIEIADRFQLRDPVIEHIAWALKADIDAGSISGRLFRESLGKALAARLLQRHNQRSLPMREIPGGFGSWKLKQVISYIEDNLESELSLAEIASVAGVSVSHL